MRLIIGGINIPRYSVVWGIGSLGNIAGNYVSFRRYMRGDNHSDLRSDWQKIGKDMQLSISQIVK